MKYLSLPALVLCLLACVFTYSASATVPDVMTYQGQLVTNGFALTATQEFSFVMLTNGATAWQSGATVTSYVERGLFAVPLGDATLMNPFPSGLLDGNNDVYLRVSVGPLGGSLTTLSPDKHVVSAADTVDAATLDSFPASAYMQYLTNIIIVGRGGVKGGAHTNNIQAAINLAAARVQPPVTRVAVLLLPAVYNENITVSNYVDIIGLDRDACIVNGTITLVANTRIENITSRGAPASTGIMVSSGTPSLENVFLDGSDGANYGIRIIGAPLVMHNCEARSLKRAAVLDEYGSIIDGLRISGCAAVIAKGNEEDIEYKNITEEGAPIFSAMINGASGMLRSYHGSRELCISNTADLLLRDIDIDTKEGNALSIYAVTNTLGVFDAFLSSQTADAVIISNAMNGWISLDDIHVTAVQDRNCIVVQRNDKMSIKDSELFTPTSGAGNCLAIVTGVTCYVQSSWLRGGTVSAILMSQSNTALYLYDSTVLCASSGNSILAPVGATAPHIADCRLERDTSNTQGVGIPGWNAFGAPGNVGGQEDSNGNIVQPMSGVPVSP